MRLFVIGTTDLTNRIVVPTYKVNRQPSYNEWTDANHQKHRDILRFVINGTFTVKFAVKEDYYNFIDLIQKNTGTDGSTPVSLYVNNCNQVFTTNVFITFDPENTLPYYGVKSYDGFEVTIEER